MKEKLPSWDLSALYKNIYDPRLKLDMKASLISAGNFSKKYRKAIKNNLNAIVLLKILREYERIIVKSVKPMIYAQLVFEADNSKHEHAVLLQKSQEEFNEVQKQLMFLELKLSELKTSKLTLLASERLLKNYHHYLENIITFKPHRLSEPEEKILADKVLTSSAAFVRLFTQHIARKKFKLKIGAKVKDMSEEEILNLTHNPNRKLRKAASESFTAGLKEESKIFTYILNVLSQDKAINDRLRRFKSPEESRHISNEIDQKTVDTMSDAVVNCYRLVSDFYNLKKKQLKLKKLYEYDRYAPIGEVHRKYSYKQARELILKNFNQFSPEFGKIAKEFFDNNWIDVPPRHGKRGGAFCAGITPDVHPAVLVNFLGHYRDVSTLAHELGHGINYYLMRKQTPVNYDNPLTLAETASVFAEMLLFDQMRNRLTNKKEKLALYMDKLAGIIATVSRQISMYKFEQEFHAERKQKGELSTEEINNIWRKSQKTMFRGSVELTQNYDWWWIYISHIYEYPFYVYAYAFGELLVLSLFAQYKKDGKKFVDKYIELLSAGSTASPQELLNPFGVNLKDKRFWQQGLDYIAELIKEAKLLSKS